MKILEDIDRFQSRINKHRPFQENFLRQLRDYFKIGLTYSSNALEGNSLTETETKVILEDGLTVSGKPLRDHYEAAGHGEAYERMIEFTGASDFSEEQIKELPRLFYQKIDPDQAGMYRTGKAIITGSRYPPPVPEEVPGFMTGLIMKLPKLKAAHHPVIYAARVHKELAFIHPFVDGNGRVSRLLMNLVLLQEGYTIALIPPVRRVDYLQALEKAHTSDSDFLLLIAEAVKETQKDYLRLLGETFPSGSSGE